MAIGISIDSAVSCPFHTPIRPVLIPATTLDHCNMNLNQAASEPFRFSGEPNAAVYLKQTTDTSLAAVDDNLRVNSFLQSATSE